MRFMVTRASDGWRPRGEVEISTVEELAELDRKMGNNDLIIRFPKSDEERAMIIIYDFYVE